MFRTFTILIGTLFSIQCFSQNWYEQKSEMQYWSGSEYIELTPNFQSVGVYFEKQIGNDLFNTLKGQYSNIQLWEQHNMLQVENDLAGGESISIEAIQNKLSKTNLKSNEKIQIIPSFIVNGTRVWLTKEVIIKSSNSNTLDDLIQVIQKFNGTVVRSLENGVFSVEIEDLSLQLDCINQLHAKGLIQWGQPDFKVELVHHIDPYFGAQYQMNNTGQTIDGRTPMPDIDIDALEAWGLSTGSNGITVAVVDDGVEPHEDLDGLLTGLTPSNNGDGSPLSNGNHGQSCAGIISANHNEIGVRGVAPDVNILPVNIFTGAETVSDLAEAFTFSKNSGADVISNSWGFREYYVSNGVTYQGPLCSTNPYPALTNAINDAAANGRNGKGCVILFSSGNYSVTGPYNNTGNECVSYPANIPSVIAVGAVSPEGTRSTYSNYGPTLDLVAPSNDVVNGFGRYGVRTLDREGNPGYNSGNYTSGFGGTSAACPAAAGAAALVLSVNPDLTGTEVFNILTGTADDMGTNGFDNEYGYGRVNAHQAVLLAQDNQPTNRPPVANIVANATTGFAPATFTFDASGSSDPDGDPLTYSWDFGDGASSGFRKVSHTYNDAGVYTVKLVVSDGSLTDETTVLITVIVEQNNAPVAVITSDVITGTAPLVVQFSGSQSTDSDNDPLTYNWAFGDGATSVDIDPSHTFVSEGTYEVSLTVSDGALQNTATLSIEVIADADPGDCISVLIDQNDFENGWGIWNDGGSDCLLRYSSRYASSGNYSIRLRDNTNTSVATTDDLDLREFETIDVSFSYLAISMDRTNEDFWLQISHDGGSTFETVEEWNKGDEFENNVRENDRVTINGPFQAQTRLRFRCDASGNSDWVYIDDITLAGCKSGSDNSVNEAPIAVFTADNFEGTTPLIVQFDASESFDPDNNVLSYSWDFGDGTTGEGVNPSHTYFDAGTFEAKLTVSDGQLSDEMSVFIDVEELPDGACTNVVIDENGFESGWGIWNDGGSDALRYRNSRYAPNGMYSARLRDNTNTSVITTDLLDLSSFQELTVSFSYMAVSMDRANEDFWLQISNDGGQTYQTVEEWNKGDEFENMENKSDEVTIAGPFSSQVKLRFRCDASGNSDWVYLDDIKISGCQFGPNNASPVHMDHSQNNEIAQIEAAFSENIVPYPNPTVAFVNLKGVPQDATIYIFNQAGQLVLQQSNTDPVDVRLWENGIYIVKVIASNISKTTKFVKQ